MNDIVSSCVAVLILGTAEARSYQEQQIIDSLYRRAMRLTSVPTFSYLFIRLLDFIIPFEYGLSYIVRELFLSLLFAYEIELL